MSDKPKNAGLTRRSFLKTTGITAASLALVGCSGDNLDVDEGKANVESEETVTYTSCSWSCSFCQYATVVRDGHVVRTEPIPGRYEKMCLKGRSRLGRTYSDERIKYPLKRAGERGENKWERITWEEAVDTIVTKWTEIAKEYGPNANSWYTCSGTQGIMHSQIGIWRRFFNGLNCTVWDLAYDQAQGTAMIHCGINWAGFNEPQDWVNSTSIVVWGSNPVEANIQSWKYLADAREAGVPLITVDPLFSQTAARSDKWFHPYPGTDCVLALGICKWLVDNDKVNYDFVKNHSTAPVIINPADNSYLRLANIDPETDVEAGNPPVAYDLATKSFLPVNECTDPALSDIPEIEGIGKVRTTWEACMEHIKDHSIEYVAEFCEMEAEDIIELAEICSSDTMYHYINMGAGAHTNGMHANFAYCWIPMMTGCFGHKGASFGGFDQWWGPYFGPNNVPTDGTVAPHVPTIVACDVLTSGKYMGEDWPIKSVWITHGNILGSNINSNRWLRDFFPNLDFIVVCDIDFTEDARWADLLLPAPHIFEYEDVVTYDTLKRLKLTEKAIDPMYDCISEFDLVNKFCEAFGANDYWPNLAETVGMTADEWWHESFYGDEYKAQGVDVGITIEKLREEKIMRWWPDPEPYVGYTNLQFYTETGRCQFYLDHVTPRVLTTPEKLEEFDEDFQRLPRYFDNPESSRNSPLAEKYPFIFMSWRNNIRVHTNGYMRLWSRDVRPEPLIWINPDDAAKIGIKNHDYVEVYNDRGHVVLKAVLSEAMRPGITAYPKGYQRHECKAGSLTEVTTDYFDAACVNSSFFDNRVAIRLWEGEDDPVHEAEIIEA